MPSMYEGQKKRINYYGVFTLWSSILILASYFVLYTSSCGEFGSIEIQCLLLVAFVAGIVMFLFSFINIAVRLFHNKCFFYLIVLLLVSVALMLFYASYRTIGQKCELTLYYERNYSLLKNITSQHDVIRKTFQTMYNRRNDHYLVSATLDLIAALLFGASAYAFRHRF